MCKRLWGLNTGEGGTREKMGTGVARIEVNDGNARCEGCQAHKGSARLEAGTRSFQCDTEDALGGARILVRHEGHIDGQNAGA